MAVRDLEGAVVAITGAGRGIGLATARALAARGARVAIGDIDATLARKAAEGLGRKGQHRGGALDVRDRTSFAAWLDSVQGTLGDIDVLVNNAGIMPMGAFLDEADALSDTQIDVNLRGVIHGCKLVLPGMIARGSGHIVNVASMAGKVAMPGLAVYCATKFAVVGLTEALREEHRDTGVEFSAVLPSKVTTELSSGTDFAQGVIPTVSPEDVADAVLLALDKQLPEIAVPRYCTTVTNLQGVLPHQLLRGLRRMANDHRILESTDNTARAGYERRLESLAGNAPRKRKS
ncbi:MAG: SDR family oxidoreductase [Pseudomonadota bacterium]